MSRSIFVICMLTKLSFAEWICVITMLSSTSVSWKVYEFGFWTLMGDKSCRDVRCWTSVLFGTVFKTAVSPRKLRPWIQGDPTIQKTNRNRNCCAICLHDLRGRSSRCCATHYWHTHQNETSLNPLWLLACFISVLIID